MSTLARHYLLKRNGHESLMPSVAVHRKPIIKHGWVKNSPRRGFSNFNALSMESNSNPLNPYYLVNMQPTFESWKIKPPIQFLMRIIHQLKQWAELCLIVVHSHLKTLKKLTDEELLAAIKEWEKQGGHVDFAIEGLANTFQTFFKETIIPSASRLRFWLDNLKGMRPIYVRAMIEGMRLRVKGKNFDNLNEWLTSSEWVLSHADRDEYRIDDESRENREWYSLREIVGVFMKHV